MKEGMKNFQANHSLFGKEKWARKVKVVNGRDHFHYSSLVSGWFSKTSSVLIRVASGEKNMDM